MRCIIVKKQTLIVMVIILLAAIALTVWLCTRPQGAALPSAPAMQNRGIEEYELNVLAGKQRALPVYSVARTDKAIALTIDAAWEDDKTAFILDTLKKHDVKATFFLCGVWVEAYPEHVKAIAEDGHVIGNHSLTHPHMNELTASAVQKEIADLDDRIEALTGSRTTLFRAPYGEYNDTVINAVREIGYEPIQWNLDTVDAEGMTSAPLFSTRAKVASIV